MGNVRFVTFGCKANQYDTQVLREALARRGWREGPERPDLVVVNTCTVTAEAGRKARQLARRIAREEPGARICMTGCLAQSEPELLRALPNVEWVLGNGEAKRPANFLRELGHELDPEELGIPAGITEFAGHTRAFLKIQDGCDMACSFCIIPSVRGPSRSRPAAELRAEVERLVQAGHVEIVLCGIHIGHWGRDLGARLPDLLRELARAEPLGEDGAPLRFRLRLSSIEATEVGDDLLEVLRAHPERIAPHLHMPMQAGDDALLARMNRWYDRDEYLASCARIRAALDRPAFTADVLVGFPGETDAEFANTLEAVRAAGFARVHVFPFSPRPGTAAAALGPPPPPEAVRERRAALSELAHGLGEDYRRGLGGAREHVVLEGGAGLAGRYQRVRVPDADPVACPGSLVEVELEVRENAREGGDGARVELLGRPRRVALEAGG